MVFTTTNRGIPFLVSCIYSCYGDVTLYNWPFNFRLLDIEHVLVQCDPANYTIKIFINLFFKKAFLSYLLLLIKFDVVRFSFMIEETGEITVQSSPYQFQLARQWIKHVFVSFQTLFRCLVTLYFSVFKVILLKKNRICSNNLKIENLKITFQS